MWNDIWDRLAEIMKNDNKVLYIQQVGRMKRQEPLNFIKLNGINPDDLPLELFDKDRV